MNYYIDTEFLEGTQDKRFLGIKHGKTVPTIDLLSLGIVAEDGREYYAVSKDFNLKEALNRYDLKDDYDINGNLVRNIKKVYWIRNFVLMPIFEYWCSLERQENPTFLNQRFSTKEFKRLLKKYGKTNKQIAEEIKDFFYLPKGYELENISKEKRRRNPDLRGFKKEHLKWTPINLYGYYSSYDHVAFCWLFGKMINLPKGFPKYTKDLKQILDEKVLKMPKEYFRKLECETCTHNVLEHLEWTGEAHSLKFRLDLIKEKDINYPKQENEHDALSDARWNKKLHEFLKQL